MKKVNKLADFLDWIHNNWYIPVGTDGEWMVDVDNEDYELEIPEANENFFTSDDLATKYLNGDGIS